MWTTAIVVGLFGVPAAVLALQGPDTGFVEVCKVADGPTVTGVFHFTIGGIVTDVPVGACSPVISVPAGTVTVTETEQAGISVSGVQTLPPGRLVSSDLGGRSARVQVVAGDESTQTTVTFTNRRELALLKICKVAGAGVPVGTDVSFTAGTVAVSVPAGPPPGGTCGVAGWFPVATNVAITETIPGGTEVSAIVVSPAGRAVGTPNLPGGSVVVRIDSGVTEVTFTNRVPPPPSVTTTTVTPTVAPTTTSPGAATTTTPPGGVATTTTTPISGATTTTAPGAGVTTTTPGGGGTSTTVPGGVTTTIAGAGATTTTPGSGATTTVPGGGATSTTIGGGGGVTTTTIGGGGGATTTTVGGGGGVTSTTIGGGGAPTTTTPPTFAATTTTPGGGGPTTVVRTAATTTTVPCIATSTTTPTFAATTTTIGGGGGSPTTTVPGGGGGSPTTTIPGGGGGGLPTTTIGGGGSPTTTVRGGGGGGGSPTTTVPGGGGGGSPTTTVPGGGSTPSTVMPAECLAASSPPGLVSAPGVVRAAPSPVTPATPRQLPTTGRRVGPMVLLAVVALVLGGLLVRSDPSERWVALGPRLASALVRPRSWPQPRPRSAGDHASWLHRGHRGGGDGVPDPDPDPDRDPEGGDGDLFPALTFVPVVVDDPGGGDEPMRLWAMVVEPDTGAVPEGPG